MYLMLTERSYNILHIYIMPNELYMGNYVFHNDLKVWCFYSDRDAEYPMTEDKLELILIKLKEINKGNKNHEG